MYFRLGRARACFGLVWNKSFFSGFEWPGTVRFGK